MCPRERRTLHEGPYSQLLLKLTGQLDVGKAILEGDLGRCVQQLSEHEVGSELTLQKLGRELLIQLVAAC